MTRLVWASALKVAATGLPVTAVGIHALAWPTFLAEAETADGKWIEPDCQSKAAAAARKFQHSATTGPHYKLNRRSISNIRRRLKHHATEFFAGRGPDIPVLAYPPSAGKTTTIVDQCVQAASRKKGVVGFFPTVALAEEVALQMPGVARVIRGLQQPDPNDPGAAMCLRADVAAAVSRQGLSVAKSLCALCPLAGACGYQAQFIDMPPVLLMPHSRLTMKLPKGFDPDHAFIDEGFASGCLEMGKITLVDLLRTIPPSFDPRLRAAFQPGPLLDHLRPYADLLKNAATAIFGAVRQRKFDGTATAVDVRKAGGARPRIALVSRIMLALLAEMKAAPRRGISHTVRLSGETANYSLPRELRALRDTPRVIVLDAFADEGLSRRLFHGRDVWFDRRDAVRNADVIQVTGSTNSVERLKNDNGVADAIARFAAWMGKGTVLFVAKQIRHRLTGEPVGQGTLPLAVPWNGIEIGHFGNLKGSNRFKDFDNVVILGRSQLPPNAIENYSGLFYRDAEPLIFAGNYRQEAREYCQPSARRAWVRVHPDRRLQALLEARREFELVQALDRLRLYNPHRRASVFIFTDLPLPIDVSWFVDQQELISDMRDLALQAGGLILDSPKWLAGRFPTRFGAASVARDWLQNGGWRSVRSVEFLNKDLLLANSTNRTASLLSPVAVRHRPAGARPSRQTAFKRGLYVGPLLETFSAVEAATGRPTEVVATLGSWAMAVNSSLPSPSLPTPKSVAEHNAYMLLGLKVAAADLRWRCHNLRIRRQLLIRQMALLLDVRSLSAASDSKYLLERSHYAAPDCHRMSEPRPLA